MEIKLMNDPLAGQKSMKALAEAMMSRGGKKDWARRIASSPDGRSSITVDI